ncbi:unnamed protein product [Adineta steineri]|uniref:Rad50/SbcC-type AAA domain-containing protein n=1 Tax=Adineta steineri TaxID=433720 RepID=A0A814VEG4_9BILA|nr:unnamed protein product [Adineta steineri]CAF3666815.1 unnamed protein product [Adineta steineri]
MNDLKQSIAFNSDMNNNNLLDSNKHELMIINDNERMFTIGQIKELHMLNFMCHKNFSIKFYPTQMQIITGANGSGKSTIANAICLCLGAQARTTGRTSNIQSFIRKGETSAQLTITLANEGPEAYKPEIYGNEIQIIRKIGSRQSSYVILDANHRIISKRKETIDEILQALSISPENPLCILHQDIAKTFLINSDSNKKYQFYMKVSQLDQMKQAYEQSICTVQLLTQRVNTMKEKHIDMLRELEPLEQEVKKIELRRDYEDERRVLEKELTLARADQIQEEINELQNELDEIETDKYEIDKQITEYNIEFVNMEQQLNDYLIEKNDLEKDTNSLRELIMHFSKQKNDIQHKIRSYIQDCDVYKNILTEVELKQIYLQQQIDKYENLNRQLDNSDQQRQKIDHEVATRRENQTEWEKIINSLANDIHSNENDIRNKQSEIDYLENEVKQKKQELNELVIIDQNQTDIYGLWMSSCLSDIQNEQRFHKKPIGPIGRYIHCTDPHWAYAVEKHLAPIMPAFICTDNHDEQILLEILASYSSDDYYPPVYVRAYSDNIPDISGTLKHIKQANVISIYDILKIDNITVECALIDFKQIEATILLENLDEVKQIRESERLNWKKIDRKVKQVVEAWTYDGSNIKFDKTFRIYTNDKQAIKYFSTDNNQSLSIKELQVNIKQLNEQIKRMNESINILKIIRQTSMGEIEQTTRANTNNNNKIREIMKELGRVNSTMPMVIDCSLDELYEKAQNYAATYKDTLRKYDEAREKKDNNLEQLAVIVENHDNLTKKLDGKTHQYELLIEKLDTKKSKYTELQEKIKKLKKQSIRFNKQILKYETKLKQLNKKHRKKFKNRNAIIRSIKDIQQKLDAITNYLKANEDTNEKRREIINEYRIKRDAAKEYKQTYERCYQQIEHLKQFINKRQESFHTIADRHQYYLRTKFQKLMEKYNFDDTNINIDHKKEELEIIVKIHQRNLKSLSGGERSISTFCFLLALWQSIYQPFRILDEIDIYMDNEKQHSSFDILYENTLQYSSSQHIILTPQSIDSQLWNDLNVPVFTMQIPKRSL